MKNHWLLCLFLSVALSVMPWIARGQTQRGQSVRIKVETGQEIDLYDESHALVIGVSDYTRGWRKLPGVRNDLSEVSRVLRAQGFSVTTVKDPSYPEFDSALRQFISQYALRERNRLVIYFAGHGHTERLSNDSDLEYIGCLSGTIFRSETESRVPPAIASLTAAPVQQFITSGAAEQQVPDNSIFRAYFVRAFEHCAGDLDNDGFITGEELDKYLTGSVVSDSCESQTPRFGKIKDSKLNIGDMVFALSRKPVPPPPPAYLVEQSLWDTVKDASRRQNWTPTVRNTVLGGPWYGCHLRNSLYANTRIHHRTAPARPQWR